MDVEYLREYCLSFAGVTESLPFDDTSLVFKVMGKMFALLSLEGDLSINVKCKPEKAIELRERYPEVVPGYHMNKDHWNTIMIDNKLPSDLVKLWIKDSYDLVAKTLPKKSKDELEKFQHDDS
jgi:predicted DNA-binding protein (MmcQ/YjbR family)